MTEFKIGDKVKWVPLVGTLDQYQARWIRAVGEVTAYIDDDRHVMVSWTLFDYEVNGQIKFLHTTVPEDIKCLRLLTQADIEDHAMKVLSRL